MKFDLPKCLTIFMSLGLLVSCTSTKYEAAESITTLDISFVDSKWDGKTVPKDEVCKRGGANGSSPVLKIENIPTGANAVIVEFNDQSYPPLSTGGGHGAIWVAVENVSSVIIPSIATESDKLPSGVNIEHIHRGRGSGIGPGIYLAPCSNGRGNLYFADVKAVEKSPSNPNSGKLLATGKIVLGRY